MSMFNHNSHCQCANQLKILEEISKAVKATESFIWYSMHRPLQNKTVGLSSSLLSKLCSGKLLYMRHKFLPEGMNDK